MREFLRRRGPTAIAVALVFVAGGATVTTAQNLITSADIKDGAVKTVDLAKNAVKSAKIANGQVKRPDLINGAVNSAKIADGQVKSVDVANNSITGTDVNEGSLGQVPSAGKVDGLDANQLTRVARMSTAASTIIPTSGSEVNYGPALSITAPKAGFVMIHGSTTVIWDGCTTGCYFTARVRHAQTGAYSTRAEASLLAEILANTSHAYVFPVHAGVNTFNIRLSRGTGDGALEGWYGELSAVFSPFGPTGAGTLSATASTEGATADKAKPVPDR
jgi:hypothetical protein